MRIAINTFGTRGDFEPYLALAQALRGNGHVVQIAAPSQFEGRAADRAVPFVALPGQMLDLMQSTEGKAAIAGGRGFTAGFKLLKHVRPKMRDLLDAEWNAVRHFQPDLIVHHPKSLASAHIAEKLDCACMLASPLPGFTPTSAFPTPLLPFRALGPFNRMSHLAAMHMGDLLFGNTIKAWRSETLKLEGRRRGAQRAGVIYAYSKHVLPKPGDWGEDVLVSGYWFAESSDWEPPPDLRAFLRDGEPPIYVGFGSMPAENARRLTSAVIDGIRLSGRRGLLASGGGALEATDMPDGIFLMAEAPHDRIFAQVAATIHHGGAGTTAASLRAGRPMTICPFFGDQPFWAHRMTQLGLSAGTLDRRHLTAEAIAAAIDRMSGQRIREEAAAFARNIRQEDGLGAAVRFMERSVV